VGTIFTLNKDGSGYRIIRSLVSTGGDGRQPQAALVAARDGSLVGTTLEGGDMNFGTLFKVRLPPAILAPLFDQIATAGTQVTFELRVSGSQPLSYQWQFNGTNIAGATNATYVIAAVRAPDAGSYSVVVSNDLGTATSTAAILRINNRLSLTRAQRARCCSLRMARMP
jgi:hypothetical protein